jgi:hypothetical protein
MITTRAVSALLPTHHRRVATSRSAPETTLPTPCVSRPPAEPARASLPAPAWIQTPAPLSLPEKACSGRGRHVQPPVTLRDIFAYRQAFPVSWCHRAEFAQSTPRADVLQRGIEFRHTAFARGPGRLR